jgi:hypothetical protein
MENKKQNDKLISIRYIGANTKEITYTNINKFTGFDVFNSNILNKVDFKAPISIKRGNSHSVKTQPGKIPQDEIFNEFKETDDEEYDPRQPNDYEKVDMNVTDLDNRTSEEKETRSTVS